MKVVAPQEHHELLLHVRQCHHGPARHVRTDKRGHHLFDPLNSSQERHLCRRVVYAQLAQVRDASHELAHLRAGGVEAHVHMLFGLEPRRLEDFTDRVRTEGVERRHLREGRRGHRRARHHPVGWCRADRHPHRPGRRWILHRPRVPTTAASLRSAPRVRSSQCAVPKSSNSSRSNLVNAAAHMVAAIPRCAREASPSVASTVAHRGAVTGNHGYGPERREEGARARGGRGERRSSRRRRR